MNARASVPTYAITEYKIETRLNLKSAQNMICEKSLS